MDANEQKARELLAAEYDRDGMLSCADSIRHEPQCLATYDDRAIRAIMAALAQQVPADGEWVPETELLALVAGPYMYHHKMDEAAMREARAFDRCRELTIQNIQTWCAMRRAMLAATPQAPQPVVDAPSVADSKAMGAKGGPSNEAERLAFEAWMHGHCWALCATWDGAGYRGDAEQSGRYCPDAARTRGLWAAWRDRDVLAALQSEKARAELYKEADESMQEEVGRLHALLYDEKARADAADSRIAALEAGMRDAEAKMRAWGDKEAGPAYAGRYYNCADELSALLNRPADGGE